MFYSIGVTQGNIDKFKDAKKGIIDMQINGGPAMGGIGVDTNNNTTKISLTDAVTNAGGTLDPTIPNNLAQQQQVIDNMFGVGTVNITNGSSGINYPGSSIAGGVTSTPINFNQNNNNINNNIGGGNNMIYGIGATNNNNTLGVQQGQGVVTQQTNQIGGIAGIGIGTQQNVAGVQNNGAVTYGYGTVNNNTGGTVGYVYNSNTVPNTGYVTQNTNNGAVVGAYTPTQVVNPYANNVVGGVVNTGYNVNPVVNSYGNNVVGGYNTQTQVVNPYGNTMNTGYNTTQVVNPYNTVNTVNTGYVTTNVNNGNNIYGYNSVPNVVQQANYGVATPASNGVVNTSLYGIAGTTITTPQPTPVVQPTTTIGGGLMNTTVSNGISTQNINAMNIPYLTSLLDSIVMNATNVKNLLSQNTVTPNVAYGGGVVYPNVNQQFTYGVGVNNQLYSPQPTTPVGAVNAVGVPNVYGGVQNGVVGAYTPTQVVNPYANNNTVNTVGTIAVGNYQPNGIMYV